MPRIPARAFWYAASENLTAVHVHRVHGRPRLAGPIQEKIVQRRFPAAFRQRRRRVQQARVDARGHRIVRVCGRRDS